MAWIGVVTNAGSALLETYAQGGHTLTLLGATSGSGTVAEANLKSQTALTSEKDDASIISATAVTGGIKYKVQVGPASASVGAYIAHQIGLWAKVDNGSRTLLMLAQDDDDGVSVPLASVSPNFAFGLYLTLAVDNTGDLTVNIDDSAFVSVGTLNAAVAALDAEIKQKASISPVAAEPGPMVTINDGVEDVPMSSVIAYITPVQAGSGDPSRDNYRVISGWTGVNVSHSGEDTSDPDIYSVSFPDAAGTVYGAYVDLAKGKLVVDVAMVDLGTLNWVTQNMSSTLQDRQGFRANISGIKAVAGTGDVPDKMMCSEYKVRSGNNVYLGNTGIGMWSTLQAVSLYDPLYTLATAEDFKDAVSGIQLVYPLASPIVYDIDPVTIKTLYGVNKLWADTGDMSIEYAADVTLYLAQRYDSALAKIGLTIYNGQLYIQPYSDE